MEIVIIVLLLASLFGVWLLSVRRKLETQEENIRNAMYQTLVQLSAEREALEGLAEFLGQTMDAETFRRMKHSLESAQTAGEAGLPEWVAEQQRELVRVQKKIAESLEGMHMVETSGLIYNDSVENYNSMLHRIPDRIAAGICGFHRKKLIEIM